MPDVKINIEWDKSELGKERELADSSVEPPPAFKRKIKLWTEYILRCQKTATCFGV